MGGMKDDARALAMVVSLGKFVRNHTQLFEGEYYFVQTTALVEHIHASLMEKYTAFTLSYVRSNVNQDNAKYYKETRIHETNFELWRKLQAARKQKGSTFFHLK